MGQSVSISNNQKKLWSRQLFRDRSRDIDNIMRFTSYINDSDTEDPMNGVVLIDRSLKAGKGDRVNFSLVGALTGSAVTGDNELAGNEEAVNSYNEQVDIDQARKAVSNTGRMDSQRLAYSDERAYRQLLTRWSREFTIRQLFLKMGGVTNTTLTDVAGVTVGTDCTWSNTPDFIPDATTVAGSGNRYLRAGTTGVGDGVDDLVAGDTLTLDDITKAAAKAKLASPKIEPISVNGEDFYVCYVHPLQARDLRISSDWKTAQYNAQIRGDKNPLFQGALGFWSNVLILENEFVPWLDVSVAGNSFRGAATGTAFAVDSARALLCGRGAVVMAEVISDEAIEVEMRDFNNIKAMAVSILGGVQKPVFNSKEYGVIAIDSAAAV